MPKASMGDVREPYMINERIPGMTPEETEAAKREFYLDPKRDGVIEEMRIRFYQRDELHSKVRAWLHESRQGHTELIMGDHIITGEDEEITFKMSCPISFNDRIVLEVENTDQDADPDNCYHDIRAIFQISSYDSGEVKR